MAQMHSMWISVKKNINCKCRLADVICHLPQPANCKGSHFHKSETGLTPLTPQRILCAKQYLISTMQKQKRFHELEAGNPSRNIIEMIFRAASKNPSKHPWLIKRVIKVKNTIDVLDRFEKYREAVKSRSCEMCKSHPRSMVDGNELMQFYGTTMTCCNNNKRTKISDLCKDPNCRVCRLIQSGFNTSYNNKNGIRLSTNSDTLSEDTTVISNRNKAKRAVIVCRTIAGIVEKDQDLLEEEHDSVGHGVDTKLEYLTVKDPSAVLPCFVIVFC
nr:Nucleic acid binding protein, putative [Ipomoea batatas]